MPGAFIETDLRQQFRNPACRRLADEDHPRKRAVEIEHVPAGQVGRETMVLRQIADGRTRRRFA